MPWIDVAAVTVAAVFANHMGLIEAAQRVIRHKLPVINCVKCAAFWLTLIVCVIDSTVSFPVMVATSFLAAYAAIWLELLFGIIDKQYEKVYSKTYPETATEAGTGTADSESAENAVPEMRITNH